MEFRILGPLDVRADERSVPLGPAKQRAVLALLLLHAGDVVPVDRIVDELWGERPPSSAVKLVQTYVSRLRRELVGAGAEAIVTRRPGYTARLDGDELDASRFERCLADARRNMANGDPTTASALFTEGLALWRGRPAEDVVLHAGGDGRVARLEELRRAARDERLEVELELGHHTRVIGEIKELIAENPFSEHPRAMLMLALYRSGRQAESLAAFRDARETLKDELGVEPGGELQELHGRILDHDPTLEPAGRGASESAAPAAPPRAHETLHELTAGAGGRRRLGLALLGAGLIAAVVIGLVAASGGSERTRLGRDRVGLIDDSGQLRTVVPVGRRPSSVSVAGHWLWTTNVDDRTVTEADLDDLTSIRSIGIRTAPTAVAASPGAAWVVEQYASRVERLDARSGTPDATVHVGAIPVAVALGHGSVWVASRGDRTVSRIDPSTVRVTDSVRVGSGPSGIATGPEGIWVSEGLSRSVALIDAESGRVVKRVGVRFAPGALATGAGSVWVTAPQSDAVSRIDPDSGAVEATVKVGDEPSAIAVTAGQVWVAERRARQVQRIDPRTSRVRSTLPLNAYPGGIAAAGAGVWVTGTSF
jgi:YVTN family beta-propeller protein